MMLVAYADPNDTLAVLHQKDSCFDAKLTHYSDQDMFFRGKRSGIEAPFVAKCLIFGGR